MMDGIVWQQWSWQISAGLIRQPKWGHLKDLHAAIKLCKPAVTAVDVYVVPQSTWLGPKQEVAIPTYLLLRSFYISELKGWCCWNCPIMNSTQKFLLFMNHWSSYSKSMCWNRSMYIQEVVIVQLFLPISIPLVSLCNFKANRTCCQGGQSASYPTATMLCSTQPRWSPPTSTPYYSGNRFEACWFRKSVVKFVLWKYVFHTF